MHCPGNDGNQGKVRENKKGSNCQGKVREFEKERGKSGKSQGISIACSKVEVYHFSMST